MPQRLSCRKRKISPLPGFDPQTVQPIVSLMVEEVRQNEVKKFQTLLYQTAKKGIYL